MHVPRWPRLPLEGARAQPVPEHTVQRASYTCRGVCSKRRQRQQQQQRQYERVSRASAGELWLLLVVCLTLLTPRGAPHLAEVFFRVAYLLLHRQCLRSDSMQHGGSAPPSNRWRAAEAVALIQPARAPAHRALWWQAFEGVEERQRQALLPEKETRDSSAETGKSARAELQGGQGRPGSQLGCTSGILSSGHVQREALLASRVLMVLVHKSHNWNHAWRLAGCC